MILSLKNQNNSRNLQYWRLLWNIIYLARKMLKTLWIMIQTRYARSPEGVKNIHSSFGVKLRECIVCTFAYIICIKRKRRRADVEDPEEACDKELEISRRVGCLEPYRKRIRFYFWPCLFPPFSSHLFLFPPRCTTVLLRTCTRIDSRYGHSVWVHVYPPSSRIHAFYDHLAAVLGMCTYLYGTFDIYTHKCRYVQLGEWRVLSTSVRIRYRNVAGANRRHACTGKSSHVTHIHTPRDLIHRRRE